MYEMNAREFNDKIAKGVFREIYPVLARQVLERTGVREGLCLDVGGGPGLFGIELAAITNLQVVIYDLLADCVTLADENAAERGLEARVSARQGCAEAIEYPDDSIDLVISRGSIFFWEDQQKGLSEIHRVLRPGGWAYVGGGFGSPELLARVVERQRVANPDWDESRRKRMARHPPEHFERMLENLGIPGVVECSPAGTWIVYQKGVAPSGSETA